MDYNYEKMDGLIYFEDGTVYKGKGFGFKGTRIAELVCNTAMAGYQQILTDPSYRGQIVSMTYPLVGNYGVSAIDNESEGIQALGLVVKDLCHQPSNSKSIKTLDQWMNEQETPGIWGVDTRAITRKIRNQGTMKCVISNEGISIEKAKELCDGAKLREDWMKETSVKEKTVLGEQSEYKVAVLDFGIKNSTADALTKRGCQLTLFPYGTPAAEILAMKPDGIFLTNGPGNPEEAKEAIEETQKLMHSSNAPMFGICLGHQILALAVGGQTYKLKFGHRGGNHGVYDKDTKRSSITSQCHGYAVQLESIMLKGMEITHLNLNDGTVEGMEHRDLPIFSVQFHPENDTEYLFDKFIDLMKGGNDNA